MARSRNQDVTEEFPSFHKGISLILDSRKLVSDGYAQSMVNLMLDEIGSVYKRNGARSMTDVGGSIAILSLHVFTTASGTRFLISHWTDGSVKRATLSGSDPSTWTNIWTGLSTAEPFRYANMVGEVWLTNGVDDFRSWDGSSATTYGSAPKGRAIGVWKDIMWQANSSGNLDRVYASDPGDPSTWPASGFVDIGKGQYQSSSTFGITTLVDTPSALVVMKRGAYYVIYDPVDFLNRIVDVDTGCVNQAALIRHKGEIYFFSPKGIARLHTDSPAVIISDHLEPLFTRGKFDVGQEKLITAYTIGDRIGFVPDAYFQIETYINYPEQPWVFHSIPTNVTVTIPASSAGGDAQRIYAGSRLADGEIFELFDEGTYQDDGLEFPSHVTTPWTDFADPDASKYLHRIRIRARSQSHTSVQFFIDYDIHNSIKTLSMQVTAGSEDEDKEYHELTGFLDIYFRKLAIRFADTGQDTAGEWGLRHTMDYESIPSEFSHQDAGWGLGGVNLFARKVGILR